LMPNFLCFFLPHTPSLLPVIFPLLSFPFIFQIFFICPSFLLCIFLFCVFRKITYSCSLVHWLPCSKSFLHHTTVNKITEFVSLLTWRHE
jgi:hypothetical protein